MSLSDQSEPNGEYRESQDRGTGEHAFPDEGYPSCAAERLYLLGPQTDERRLVELIAAIGHEFRTPLAAIHGYTTLLLGHFQQLSAQECEEFLQFIQQAGLHMENLLERLFEIAELETGSVPLQWSLVDIPVADVAHAS